MSTTCLPTLNDFAIEACYDPEQRKLRWYAEVRVRDTGNRFLRTPFVRTERAAMQAAGRMIGEAIRRHEEAGR